MKMGTLWCGNKIYDKVEISKPGDLRALLSKLKSNFESLLLGWAGSTNSAESCWRQRSISIEVWLGWHHPAKQWRNEEISDFQASERVLVHHGVKPTRYTQYITGEPHSSVPLSSLPLSLVPFPNPSFLCFPNAHLLCYILLANLNYKVKFSQPPHNFCSSYSKHNSFYFKLELQ